MDATRWPCISVHTMEVNGGVERQLVFDRDLHPFVLLDVQFRTRELVIDVDHIPCETIRGAFFPCQLEFERLRAHVSREQRPDKE
jgi:hypothetical protein